MDDVIKALIPKHRKRFTQLLTRYSLAAKAGDTFEIIRKRYTEPHRFYHTLEHIQHCLEQFDTVSEDLHDPDAVEMSIWFHDIVYEINDPNNENLSAELFSDLIGQYLSDDQSKKIVEHILATIHPSEPSDHDARYVVDIDLSSIGGSWALFLKDNQSLRQENPDVPHEQYMERKIKFLKSILDRPNFFLTKFFRDRLEEQARSNIRRHIKEAEELTI